MHAIAFKLTIVSFVLSLFITVSTSLAQSSQQPPILESDSEVATAGFYRLRWQMPDDEGTPRFEVQEASSPDFEAAVTAYEGRDRATVMSGREDGEYHYRVRAHLQDGTTPWSETVSVRVSHHPLARAFTFFTIGAVVFVATLGLVVGGTLRQDRKA